MGTLFSSLKARVSRHTGPATQDANTGSTLDPSSVSNPSVGEAVDAPQSPEILDDCSNPAPPTAMFALIIGIDGYTSSQLYGAVSDANAMTEFLQRSLGVPKDHIQMLLDAQASRRAIIDAFKAIADDKRIQKGDPILIFFAGHGIERPAPRSWNTEGKVHCLLPHDYDHEDTKPIPGRTIGALLENIAQEKGNNITVIFDCCYSAGLARDKSDECISRTIDLDVEIPDDLDRDIWRSRAGAIPDSFAYHGIRSHVLLAACGENERALERRGHGQFTTALLETLKNCIADTSLTYAQVLERIHIDNQSPHCVGIHQHRMLFDVRMLSGRQVRYHARVDGERKYVVGAGLAHGISPRVEFTLYDDRGQHLGVAKPVVDGIDEFHSTITSSEHLPQASFAKLTRSGDVSVYLVPRADLQETFKRMAEQGANVPNFQLVEEAREAQLQVGMDGDQVVFTILDEQVKNFGLTRLPRTSSLDSVAHIIRAASHFYWYLRLNRTTVTSDGVIVDFYRLQRPFDNFDLSDFELPFLQPIEPGLYQKGPTPVIDFVVDPKALYGIEIKNNTTRDLYLNVFLFNNSSLSIVPCYIQSSAGSPDAPLKRKKTYTIGYGIVGTSPLGFALEEGQDIDVAYLKFFFSTRPVDLTDIEQISPFSGVDGQLSMDGKSRKGGVAVGKRHSQDIWFTMVIPVVQRRA